MELESILNVDAGAVPSAVRQAEFYGGCAGTTTWIGRKAERKRAGTEVRTSVPFSAARWIELISNTVFLIDNISKKEYNIDAEVKWLV